MALAVGAPSKLSGDFPLRERAMSVRVVPAALFSRVIGDVPTRAT